jgi:hypothetical protein
MRKLILILILLFTCSFVMADTISDNLLTYSLSYYPLNQSGAITDYISGYNANFTNTTLNTSCRIGYNAACQYFGGNTFAKLSNYFKTRQTGSISIWVYYTNITGVMSPFVLSSGATNQDFSGFNLIDSATNYTNFGTTTAGVTKLGISSRNVTNINTWIHYLFTDGTDGNNVFINGNPANLTYTTGTNSTHAWFANATGIDTTTLGALRFSGIYQYYMNGYIDELIIMNNTLKLNQTYAQRLYNNGLSCSYPYNCTSVLEISNINCTTCNIPYGDTVSPYLTNDTTPTFTFTTNVQAKCRFDNENLSYVLMSSAYQCIGGEDTTSHTCILNSANALTNQNQYLYLACNSTFGNLTNTTSLLTNLTVLYFNVSYSNYTTYLGINYTRSLKANITYRCLPSVYNSSLRFNIFNNTGVFYTSDERNYTCDNNYTSLVYNINDDIEGNDSYLVEAVISPSFPHVIKHFAQNTTSLSWRFDLYNPNVTIDLNSSAIGFLSSSTNISINCSDNIMNYINYNLTFNNINYINSSNRSNNSYLSNLTNISNGWNLLEGSCTDLFGTGYNSISEYFLSITFYLINERTGQAFNVNNLTSAKLYIDKNMSYYDFKNTSTNTTNYTALDNFKTRLELIYPGGIVINRYIDINLTNQSIVRLCANTDDVVHYELIMESSSTKPAILKNVFANCYVAADYTRFAYQYVQMLPAFTIPAQYYLYSYDENGNIVNLIGINGGNALTISLDTLSFLNKIYNISFTRNFISLNDLPDDTFNNTFLIYFRNIYNDNTAGTLTVSNTNGSVYYTGALTNPNNESIYFNYATLNVSDTTTFDIMFTLNSATGTVVIHKYYTLGSEIVSEAELPTGLVIIVSVIFAAVALTLTGISTTFGGFGLVILVINMIFVGFAPEGIYKTWLIGIYAIMALFMVVVIIKSKGRGMVTT